MRRLVYSGILYLIVPLVLLRLWMRSWKQAAYAQQISQRFGFIQAPPGNAELIWIHAVSVGEVRAVAPLIRALAERYPRHRLHISTTTPTGAEQVALLFGSSVSHCYFPYDLPDVVRRFVSRLNPSMLLVMETEIWPNLFAHCHRRDIPVALINARISPRSFSRYRRFKGFVRETLRHVCLIAVRDDEDRDRFLALGAIPARLQRMGNLKFDFEISEQQVTEGRELRQSWGTRPVWIAASTHDGEESLVLDTHRQILRHLPDTLLIWVPRHPERFAPVAKLLEKQKDWECVRRSQHQTVTDSTQVFLGDSLGEMMRWYSAADVAFVAGSFLPVGGHNPLEPAAISKPIITGPIIFNFDDAYQRLFAAQAAEMARVPSELAEKLLARLRAVQEGEVPSSAGRSVVIQNQGALRRAVNFISQIKPAK